ncbi:MAG: AAA family ATPase [Thermoguttaceae bacterium]
MSAATDSRQGKAAGTSPEFEQRVAGIRQSLELLHEPGTVFEVRALGVKSGKYENTVSGYYDDVAKAARDIANLDTFRSPKGIYCTLNPCNGALLGRANNRMVDRPKSTTQDSEITRRRWLFFDIDPERPSGIAADGYEVALAQTLGMRIEFVLRERGWPAPLKVDSGNGCYRLYRIDLPNDEPSLELIKNCYAGLNELLGGYDPSKPHATLDTTVYNAARIARVGGTWNRKGDPTSDRPHRICVYHEPEHAAEPVPAELLRELTALAPSAQSQAQSNGKPTGPSANGSARRTGAMRSRLVVPAYLRAHGIEFTTKESPGRTIYKVQCPFDEAHGAGGETAVMQRGDGLTTFECKHKSCLGKYHWRDFRDRIGIPDPSHYDPPLSSTTGRAKSAATTSATAPGEGQEPEATESTPPTFTTSLMTSAEFDQAAYHQEFLIRDVLVAGQPCVGGGRSKTLKTTLIGIDMAVSLGSGTPFLGYFDTKPCRVAFWSGEAGAATIQGKARRVAEAHGVALADCSCFWSFDLPKLGRMDHVDAMAEIIQRHALDAIVVDPLYLSLLDGSENGKPSDLFFMGSKLLPLSELGQASGCTIVVLHHFRKSGNGDGEEVALEELSQSGVAEWARQWILLARRSVYQHDGRHELWMRCGGSAGHAGLYGVDIDEGTVDENFDGRRWEVEVEPGHQVMQTARIDRVTAKAERQREEDEAGQKAVVEALAKLPKREPVFIKGLYKLTGIGEKRLGRLLHQLTEKNIVEECTALQAPNHKTPKPGAYRLTEAWYEE